MATINSSIKEEQPPPPPSATTINPLSSFHHPSCAVSRCQQHRRAVRKQLFKWSKNVLYLVGFEEVAERMMDREKWLKTTARYAATSSNKSLSPPASSLTVNQEPKDFDPDNPDTVHDPLCPVKISTSINPFDQLAIPESLLPTTSNSCTCDPPLDDCPTCFDDDSSGEDSMSDTQPLLEPIEQPLDLSIKGSSTSSSATPKHVDAPQKVSGISSSPSILKSSPSPRVKSKTQKNWNRCYTEEALDSALTAIKNGELGTRRAALIYKVPRSTLRNKVYKMNLKPSALRKQRNNNQDSLINRKVKLEPGVPSESSRGQEALREMLINKRESNKSTTTTTAIKQELPFQAQESKQPFSATIPSSSSPFSSFSEQINTAPDPSSLITTPFAMDVNGLLLNPEISAQLEYLKNFALTYEVFRLAAAQYTERATNKEAAWQEFIQLWSSFSNPALLNACNSLPNQAVSLYESLINGQQQQFQSGKQQFDDQDSSDHETSSQDPLQNLSTGYLSNFNQSMKNSSSSSSTVENSASGQVILKVPSFKSAPVAALKDQSSRSQNLIPKSAINSDLGNASPEHSISTNDPDEDDGFEGKLTIKSEEFPCTEPVKVSKKKSRKSIDVLSSNDQIVDGSCRNRPKRGRYRNYNKEDLEQAVKAVQEGKMSVHKAGNHFGVPHSTLEYKVKDRKTLRQKKQLSQLGTESPDEVGTRNSRTSSTDSLPVNINSVQSTNSDGNNDSNNNSLWNEQLKPATLAHDPLQSLFAASDQMKQLQMIQCDGQPPSNGLLEKIIRSKLSKATMEQTNGSRNGSDENGEMSMDDEMEQSSPIQSSLNVLKEIIASAHHPPATESAL